MNGVPEPRTGDVVGKMHVYGITYESLANRLGWTKAYLGMLLNGKRPTSKARGRIESELDAMILEKIGCKKESE